MFEDRIWAWLEFQDIEHLSRYYHHSLEGKGQCLQLGKSWPNIVLLSSFSDFVLSPKVTFSPFFHLISPDWNLSPRYIWLSSIDSWRLNLDFNFLQEFEIPTECSCELMRASHPVNTKAIRVPQSSKHGVQTADSFLKVEKHDENILEAGWATLGEEGSNIVCHWIRPWKIQVFELAVWLQIKLGCCFSYKMKTSILEEPVMNLDGAAERLNKCTEKALGRD